MDDEDEKNFCYVEGTTIDKSAASDSSDLHENVWYRMKPPKRTTTMYHPSVSARQIDLIRNMILGKTSLKPPDVEVRALSVEIPERRDVIEKPCLKLKKSSVKFLIEHAYK